MLNHIGTHQETRATGREFNQLLRVSLILDRELFTVEHQHWLRGLTSLASGNE